MLCDEGALMLKFWFHLSKRQQKKRLKELAKRPEDALARDRARLGVLQASTTRFARSASTLLRETSTGEAPWIVVEGADPRYRTLTVGSTLLAAMRERLDEKPRQAPAATRRRRCPRRSTT